MDKLCEAKSILSDPAPILSSGTNQTGIGYNLCMKRSIERIFKGSPEHWVGNGFRVNNYFPSATDFEKRMSPFFLLDYHQPYHYTPTSERRGVGTHPHRGFETVTIAYQGSV